MVWLVVGAVLFVAAAWYSRGALRDGKPARRNAPEQGSLDLYHVAFLAGGPARVADVALLAAWARGALTIGADGRIGPAGQDPSGDGYAAAVQSAMPTGTVAGARAAVAGSPAVRAVRDRLFRLGMVNPAARTARLRTTRVVLAVVPLVAAAGLFVAPLAGSPSGDTGIWVANLVLVLLGALGCGVLAYWLFTSYDRLRAPLNDLSMFYLWNEVRDPAQLLHIAQSAPGGAQFGEVALYGLERVPEPTLRGVFRQAAQVTAGQIRSDGWTEAQWHAAANSRGELGGTTMLEAHRAAQAPGTPGGSGVPSQGQYPGQPQAGNVYGGGANAPEQPFVPPWEERPRP